MCVRESVPGRVVPVFRGNWLAAFAPTKLWQSQERSRRHRRAATPTSPLKYWLVPIVISLHTPSHPFHEPPATTATSALRSANEILYRDNGRIMSVASPDASLFQRISASIGFELGRRRHGKKLSEWMEDAREFAVGFGIASKLNQDRIVNFVCVEMRFMWPIINCHQWCFTRQPDKLSTSKC